MGTNTFFYEGIILQSTDFDWTKLASPYEMWFDGHCYSFDYVGTNGLCFQKGRSFPDSLKIFGTEGKMHIFHHHGNVSIVPSKDPWIETYRFYPDRFDSKINNCYLDIKIL